MYMHVGGQLPIRLFSLCCALVQLLTEDVRRHILFDQSAFVGAVSLRSAWCVRALIFIQTFSVFCNHGAQGIQTYPGTVISICMGPLLLNSHTKGRRAAQPRGPGGKQWDFSSPQPQPEGQVQTTSPPCKTTLQLKGEAVLNFCSAQQRGQGSFVCCFLLLLSYKKSWAQAQCVNRKWSLTILRGVCAFNCSRTVKCVTLSHNISTQPNVFHLNFPQR